MTQDLSGKYLVLYDGLCGLCNRANRFILKWDRRNAFRFAPLQGPRAAQILSGYPGATRALETFYIVIGAGTPGERILGKSQAVFFVLNELGWPWKIARVFSWIPRALPDFAYDLVAKNRYRVFGKHESCPVPDVGHREKFLDL